MKLTTKQRAALHSVEWGTGHFGGLASTRATPAYRLRRLEEMGLVECQGRTEVCDNNGAPTGRTGTGWILTRAGLSLCKQLAPDNGARWFQLLKESIDRWEKAKRGRTVHPYRGRR